MEQKTACELQGDASGAKRYAERGGPSVKKTPRFEMTGETHTCNAAADVVDLLSTQREPQEAAVAAVLAVKEEKKRAKEKKKAKREKNAANGDAMDVDGQSSPVKEEKKDKKKRRERAKSGMQLWTGNAQRPKRSGRSGSG